MIITFVSCTPLPLSLSRFMTNELKKDPAIEKWAAMREHTHFYYRFNFRKLIPTAVLLGLIPAGIVYFTSKSFVRHIAVNTEFLVFVCRIIMRKLGI